MAEKEEKKIAFEDALTETGFGTYNCLHAALTGTIIISYGFITYGSSIIVPASACELNTTAGQQGLLAAMPIVGVIIGAFVWGFLADTRGRHGMLLIALVSSAAVNAVASLSVNWVMLLICNFIASFLAAGEYSLSMTLLSESVMMARRNLMLLLVSCIFLLAQGLMAILAIPIIPLSYSYHLEGLGIYWNSWRTLLLMFSAPSIVSALWLMTIRESPKFVFMKGDEKEAISILNEIYRRNKGKHAEEYQVKRLIVETPEKSKDAKAEGNLFLNQIVPLFRRPLLKYTVIMATLFVFQQVGAFVVWLPTISNQFVQIIENGEGTNSSICSLLRADQSDLEDHEDHEPASNICAINTVALLIVFGVGCVQSFTNIIISLLVEKTGRRNMVIIIAAVAGICGILTNLVPNAIGGAILLTIFLCGLLVIGLYTALSISLFPTHIRAMAVSLTMTAGRITLFAAVQILNYLIVNNCEVGFYLFASLFAASAIVALLLPNI